MHAGDAVPLVAARTCAMDAALLVMTEKRFGCLGVVDADGRLAGIVTDGDLRRAMGAGPADAPGRRVMTARPRTIGPEALAAEALHAMNAHGRGRSPRCSWSMRRGAPVGILHIHDLLRAGVA